MFEGIPKKVSDLKEKSTYHLAGLSELGKVVQRAGLQGGAQRLLEAAKVEPVYLVEQKDSSLFKENRRRLNTEPGLIIANHPGYFDSALILNTLKREDVKVIVSNSAHKKLLPILGEAHLIVATDDAREIISFLRSIKQHIESGGIIILYPTAGSERADEGNHDFEFEKGLSVILRRCMTPSDMVYSFQINPEDIRATLGQGLSRHVGASVSFATRDIIRPNKSKPIIPVQVKERYSQAEEWLLSLKEKTDSDRSKILTEHFLSQFKEE